MKIVTELKKIYRIYRRFESPLLYSLGIQNMAPLYKNLIYISHHLFCCLCYRIQSLFYSARACSGMQTYAADVKQEGFCVILPTPEDQALIRDIPERLLKKLESQDSITKFPFLRRYFFDVAEFESVRFLLTTKIQAVIQSVLGANFQIISSYLFRTAPPKAHYDPSSSFLWHIDNNPDCEYKLYYYLTDTDKTNGAIQVHERQDSQELKKWDLLTAEMFQIRLWKDFRTAATFTLSKV